MATFRNNKKKDQFSHKTMATFSKTDLGILLHLRWNSLRQLVMVRFTTNGQQYLHVAAETQPSLQAKLKSDENGHALKVASDTISCFVDAFTFFQKYQLLAVSLTFCFISKSNYKMKTGIIANFIFWGFINRSNPQHMF